MYEPESTLTMLDDGLHLDGAAHDGLYGASVPAVAGDGQLLRYAVMAEDMAGNVTRWPLASEDGPQYEGTMVQSTNLSSQLPMIHVFANPNTLALLDTPLGARVSVFSDGEYYDNVSMKAQSNDPVVYPKKSHEVTFSGQQRFRQPISGRRIRQCLFLAEYVDPSYLRQNLSFWLMRALGVPAPFHEPVRLELNGEFYQLAFLSEGFDEAMLDELDYDPLGASYLNAGTIVPSQFSTAGFAKMTRRWDTNDEFLSWQRSIERHGMAGLRTTRLQQYR